MVMDVYNLSGHLIAHVPCLEYRHFHIISYPISPINLEGRMILLFEV